MNTHPNFNRNNVPQNLMDQWGWIVALGVLVLFLGIIVAGNLLTATIASMFFIGGMLFINGVIHIIQSFRIKDWSGALWFGVVGLGYSIAGIFVASEPGVAALAFTLFIGSALLVAGISRLVMGFRLRPLNGWVWVVISALLTILLALIILIGWPVNGLWIIGLFLAIDLITQGIGLIFFGLGIKSLKDNG